MTFDILLYTLLAILPSCLWLLFFLWQDKDPEPKTRILTIFLLGIVVAVPVVIVENILLDTTNACSFSVGAGLFDSLITLLKCLFVPFTAFFLLMPPVIQNLLKLFVAVALVEELFKYFVVRLAVFGQQDFDEPMDVPIYMMVSALGFAAAENILIMNNTLYESAFDPYLLIIARFLGATFLHALASGLFGCFIALSFYNLKKRNFYFFCGLATATLLHGFYNFFIMNFGESLQFEFLSMLLALLAGATILLFVLFRKIKKLKSVCKIK